MNKDKLAKQLISEGRSFMKAYSGIDLPAWESDQDKQLPQPPLVKTAISDSIIDLPVNFQDIKFTDNLTELLLKRKSNRLYSQENISLLELSYLLWSIQGIKGIRGKKYATLRTVPCGGARHQFETYLFINHVDGLETGLYHYLPMGHKLEFIGKESDMEKINRSLCEQSWALKSSVIFYWSIVAYRVEWRYGIFAHKTALIDIGHVGENLYLAATALGLGTCGLGAYDQKICDEMFNLDGEEEFIVYTQALGTIDKSKLNEEKEFYSFVYEEGL